jgi:hypothetical protein
VLSEDEREFRARQFERAHYMRLAELSAAKRRRS